MPTRRSVLQASAAALVAAAVLQPASAFVAPHSLQVPTKPSTWSDSTTSLLASTPDTEIDSSASSSVSVPTVAYRSLSLSIPGFDVSVPVACWFPVQGNDSTRTSSPVYNHKISIRRIGQLLAGWKWIPGFAEKKFSLAPTIDRSACNLIDGQNIEFQTGSRVVLLAHGYLGSRFDLANLAEDLARQGFVCVAPEYPESLSASYERVEGLDRAAINRPLLDLIETEMKPKSYGIVGHSLGCGTALQTGDERWVRVLIAGFPPSIAASKTDATTIAPFTSQSAWKTFALSPDSPLLFISSLNDGTVRFGGGLTVPPSYTLLQESELGSTAPLDKHSALVFDRKGAPNHISYLSEGVNNAMIDLLSPLLPVAKSLNIPVLDFDKYQESQDSEQTGRIIRPLISQFLLEQMDE